MSDEMEVVATDEEVVRLENIHDYLAFIRSQGKTFMWVMREVTTKQSRYYGKWMVVGIAVLAALMVSLPYVVGQVASELTKGDSSKALASIGAFVGISCVLQLVSYVTDVCREWFFGLNLCRLDERITELFFEKTLGQHEQHGSRLNTATVDKGKWKVLEIQYAILFQALPSVTLALLSLIGLWSISAVVGVLGSFVTMLFVFWSLFLNQAVGKTMQPIERELRRINRVRFERWEKVHRVITSSMAKRDNSMLSQDMDAVLKKDRAFWIWFAKHAEARGLLLQRIFQALVMLYGVYQVSLEVWSIGALFPLFMWTEMLVVNMAILSDVERGIARNIIPVQLMIEALSIKPNFIHDKGETLTRNGPLSISFRGVSYAYASERGDGEGAKVLSNISFDIKRGEKVALLGESGAGKTTIMKLLLRFDDPTAGVVCVNGVPLKDLSLDSFMQQVGYIPQQALILDGTLRENLLYGIPEEEERAYLEHGGKKLWDLMHSLKIDFGSRLTEGLETKVGRHGLKLSGGQSQRVMIGAAVAKRPRLMIIDEATSSLDSTTEKEVQRGLEDALSLGVSALVVAHRLSTVRQLCDRFIVLRPLEEVREGESQIEAIGTSFEELFEKSPTFRRLATNQGLTFG